MVADDTCEENMGGGDGVALTVETSPIDDGADKPTAMATTSYQGILKDQRISPRTSSASSSSKENGKRSKPEAPKFLLLLYEILQEENRDVIRWAEDGLSLQILDPDNVTEQILPKYFNHTSGRNPRPTFARSATRTFDTTSPSCCS